MTLSDYLPVGLCVFTQQKIDQAGGPETFLIVWPYTIKLLATPMYKPEIINYVAIILSLK